MKGRIIVAGVSAAFAALIADATYCLGVAVGRKLPKTSEPVDLDPSPEDTGEVEPDDAPSPTESDEE